MDDIKRYTPLYMMSMSHELYGMYERHDGEWVSYSDYQKLLDVYNQLIGENRWLIQQNQLVTQN